MSETVLGFSQDPDTENVLTIYLFWVRTLAIYHVIWIISCCYSSNRSPFTRFLGKISDVLNFFYPLLLLVSCITAIILTQLINSTNDPVLKGLPSFVTMFVGILALIVLITRYDDCLVLTPWKWRWPQAELQIKKEDLDLSMNIMENRAELIPPEELDPEVLKLKLILHLKILMEKGNESQAFIAKHYNALACNDISPEELMMNRSPLFHSIPFLEIETKIVQTGFTKRFLPEGSEETLCGVCLIPMKKYDAATSMDCEHVAHFDCFVEWCKSNPTCPICKRKYRLDLISWLGTIFESEDD